MSTTMTIRLDAEVKERLDQLSEATQRSKSYLAAEAIRAFVDTNAWQIREIQAALAEADAGDFASDEEVARVARKWRARARSVALQGSAQPRGRGRFQAIEDPKAARLVISLPRPAPPATARNCRPAPRAAAAAAPASSSAGPVRARSGA